MLRTLTTRNKRRREGKQHMKIMRNPVLLAVVFLFLTTLSSPSAEESLTVRHLTVASGAGYRALVDELSEVFTRSTGTRVEKIYGNMGQVTSQARVSGVVDIVIGDKAFFERAKLAWDGEFSLGKGKLVLAFAKGTGPVDAGTLRMEGIERICLPDPDRTIYGRAAREYLERSGLAGIVSKKLVPVATLPQVSAYLIRGEAELGFINLIDARGIEDKIEGYLEIPGEFYSPIQVVALRMPGAPSQAEAFRFGSFLDTAEARRIIREHGL